MELLKLNKWNKVKLWFGYKYCVNNTSKQIHNVDNLKAGCQAHTMTDYTLVTEKKMLKLLTKDKYDGCFWCNRKYNNDKSNIQK